VRCSEVRPLIGGYVLDALEPHEDELVRQHIASCPDCAREYAELAPVPVLLGAVADPEAAPAEPPLTLEQAVLDRFARERPRAEGATEAAGAGAVTGAAEATGTTAAGGTPGDDGTTGTGETTAAGAPAGPPSSPTGSAPNGWRTRAARWLARPLPAAGAAAAAAVVLTLAATGAFESGDGGGGPKVYGAHLHAASGGAAGERPYAYARLSSLETGTRVELEASGLGAGSGAVYELWCVYPDGSKVSGGTFRADAEGRAEATMTTAARVGDYHHLTVEQRRPGKPAARVLAGDIAY
jgi:hypothetical protein